MVKRKTLGKKRIKKRGKTGKKTRLMRGWGKDFDDYEMEFVNKHIDITQAEYDVLQFETDKIILHNKNTYKLQFNPKNYEKIEYVIFNNEKYKFVSKEDLYKDDNDNKDNYDYRITFKGKPEPTSYLQTILGHLPKK